MSAKFTILVAAGLLIAGVSQAQNAVAFNNTDIKNPHHKMVREHKEVRQDKHRVHQHRKHVRHHHKVMKHHHKKF